MQQQWQAAQHSARLTTQHAQAYAEVTSMRQVLRGWQPQPLAALRVTCRAVNNLFTVSGTDSIGNEVQNDSNYMI